jgi:hypothetical protein
MNIITSKTRKRIRTEEKKRSQVTYSRPAFEKQYAEVEKGENKWEYLREKRIQELASKGFNVDAISGMLDGEKGTDSKGEIRKTIEKMKSGTSSIKLDGNI